MAVGKEAPIMNGIVHAAQCREELESAVERFTEIISAVPIATVKKRFKETTVIIPFTVPFASPYAEIVAPEIECSNGFHVEGLKAKQ